MKVELHLHTSRYSQCAVNRPQEMIRRLIETGYDAVYITEHDKIWPGDEIARLQSDFPQIRIFSGLELTIGMQHLLILPADDPTYLLMNDAEEILATAHQEGRLTVLTHPYRWEGGATMLDGGLLPDALEYRSPNQDAEATAKSLAAAERLGLPVINSGDVHTAEYAGWYWVNTDRPIEQPTDIRDIIVEGTYTNRAWNEDR